MADAIRATEKEPDIFILPENHEAVRLFLRLQSQWDGGHLIYSSVFSLMDLYEIQDKKDCFDRVQCMEFCAMEVLNK